MYPAHAKHAGRITEQAYICEALYDGISLFQRVGMELIEERQRNWLVP